MQVGKGGGWFCPNKMPDGSWCPTRYAKEDFQTTPAPSPAPVAANWEPVSNGPDARYIAALNFAAAVYRGLGPEAGDDALAFAMRVYRSFP